MLQPVAFVIGTKTETPQAEACPTGQLPSGAQVLEGDFFSAPGSVTLEVSNATNRKI
jgi:hypothetical protein